MNKLPRRIVTGACLVAGCFILGHQALASTNPGVAFVASKPK